MQRVVVTGSTGFIGRYAVPLLVKLGYQVYPFRINLYDPHENELRLKDLAPDALLHLAWETTPGLFWHLPSNLTWLKSSIDLIEAFVQCGGKRVVIAGSCAEQFPYTIYAATKESLRLTSAAYLQREGVSLAWGRIFFPYGPYEKQGRLIPSLIQKLLEKAPFVCSAQDHVRDLIHVEDIAEAFAALVASDIEGIVDIGHGKGVTIGEVVQMIAQKIDAQASISFSSSPDRPDNPARLVAQANRLFDEVKFKPKYSLEEGINQTIHWWKHEIRH